MKKLGAFVLMGMVTMGCYAQKLAEGSLDALKGESRMNVELNYNNAVLKGMSFKDYVAQEENWDKGVKEIQAKFVEEFNKSNKGKTTIGSFDNAKYTLRIDAIKVEKRGTTTADAYVVDAEGKTIAKITKIEGEGGKWGTHLNLMGDGATNMGALLGKFFKSKVK